MSGLQKETRSYNTEQAHRTTGETGFEEFSVKLFNEILADAYSKRKAAKLQAVTLNSQSVQPTQE